MLLSPHADTDRSDPRRWRVGAHRHASRATGGVPPQHLHATQRCCRGIEGPHSAGGRWSCVGTGVARHNRPLARLHLNSSHHRGPHNISEDIKPVHTSLWRQDDPRALLHHHVDATPDHSHVSRSGCDPDGLITKRVVPRKCQPRWGWLDDDDHAADNIRRAS